MISLRLHQQELADHIDAVINGTELLDRTIIMSVTPGGGKSLCSQLATRLIDASLVDAVGVIVPRQALQTQASDDFVDPGNRALVGHSHAINAATNAVNPCRGTGGYVSTYQALEADAAGINSFEFQTKRYALFLDEVHHLSDGGKWHRAVQPLVDQAVFLVLMTGTLYRGDGQPIGFLPYKSASDGLEVDLNSPDHLFIHYSRCDGLREKALIPAEFSRIDGNASWLEADGRPSSVDSLADEGDPRKSLYTALHTQLALEILQQCLDNFLPYQKDNPGAKLLVVSPNVHQARVHLQYVATVTSTPAAIAVSENSEAAKTAIRDFRYGKLQILVSVGMAYEGLDVPSITHLACLTGIRSRPWIEQVFGRATRRDYKAGPYHGQQAFIWIPDDPLMNEIIAGIQADEALVVSEEKPDGDSPCENQAGSSPQGGAIVPVGSNLVRIRTDVMDGVSLSYEETQGVIDLIKAHGMEGASVVKISDMLTSLGVPLPKVAANDPRVEPPLTPADRMKAVRDRIEQRIRTYEYLQKITYGTTNRALKRQFGKGRGDMDLAELLEEWDFVRINYRLDQIPESEVI